MRGKRQAIGRIGIWTSSRLWDGGDHVCVQAFTADQEAGGGRPTLPRSACRTLADVLL